MIASQPDPDFIAQWHANLRARELRDLGLSYPAISIVLREYHDVDRSVEHWRTQVRRQGAPPALRGRGFGQLRKTRVGQR